MNSAAKFRSLAALLVGVVAVGCSSRGSNEAAGPDSDGSPSGSVSSGSPVRTGSPVSSGGPVSSSNPVSSGVIPSSQESAPTGTPATGDPGASIPDGWTADEISVDVGGTTVYGTFLHPADPAPVPAALLIAGSGPTDRDGNSPGIPGSADTLANLAGELSAAGVATLRYDKVGSGKTGLGAFADRPGDIGAGDFTDQARAALRFLADQPAVDADRVSVYGHSEGALFALQLAARPEADDPAVHSIGLLEPLALRYLDLITHQVKAQVEAQRDGGVITDEQAEQALDQLHGAVEQLRSDGTVPDGLSYGLDTLFNPGTLTFLREADRLDPQDLAGELPPTMPVLLSCSDADIQVSCDDVSALAQAVAGPDELLRLTGVNHVLKQDPSGDPAGYGKDLPFSEQLSTALTAFASR